MFISKRKFEKALENARMQGAKETEERNWYQQRLNRLEEDFCRKISAIEEKFYKLEHPNGVEGHIKPMG